MEMGEAKIGEYPPPRSHISFMGTQISLRILSAAATLAAAWITLTSNQTTLLFGIEFDARYTYSSAFKFFVIANFIVFACSVLSIFVAFVLGRRASSPTSYFYLFLYDLLVTTLLMAGCAATSAEGYVGRYGNSHSGWLPICDHFTKFCHRITVAVSLSYFAFALCLSLTIISANKSRHIPV